MIDKYEDLIRRLENPTLDMAPWRKFHRELAAAINELVAERDMWQRRYEAMKANCEAWIKRADAAEADLGNLLAIMLGDGGHYQHECGTDAAIKAATELWYAWIKRAEKAEAELAVARAEGFPPNPPDLTEISP